MQSSNVAKWLSEQLGGGKTQYRGKRGRGSSRSSVVRLCGILAVVAVGAYLTIKLMGVATSSSTPSVFTLAEDGETNVLGVREKGAIPSLRANKMLLNPEDSSADAGPFSLSAIRNSSEKPAEVLQGLWQQANLPTNSSDTTGPTAKTQHAQQGAVAQQAQQGSVAQQNRSDMLTEALKSKDAQTIEQALADSLTDSGLQSPTLQQGAHMTGSGNSTTSAAPAGRAGSSVPRLRPSAQHAGMLGIDQDDTRTDAGSGSVQPADKKKNWSSFLDDDNDKVATQTERVSTESLEGLTQTQAGNSIPQEQSWEGSGSLRDSSESDSTEAEPDATELSLRQRDSGYAEPKTRASQTGTTTQQTLTEQGSQQFQGATGLPQTGLAQSQRSVTQPQGESRSQLPDSGSRSMAEGLPADWDWQGYLRLNPDVATAVGTDAASAKLHWLTWGQAEKRPYKASMVADFQAGQAQTLQQQQHVSPQDEGSSNVRQRSDLASSATIQALESMSDDMPVIDGPQDLTFGDVAAQSLGQSDTDSRSAAAINAQLPDQSVRDPDHMGQLEGDLRQADLSMSM